MSCAVNPPVGDGPRPAVEVNAAPLPEVPHVEAFAQFVLGQGGLNQQETKETEKSKRRFHGAVAGVDEKAV